MRYTPYRHPMKIIPLALVRLLVEEALDQPNPTKKLRAILQMVLEQGEHGDRLT